MSDTRNGWSDADAGRIVAAAFLALFDRLPDERAREFYVDHLVHGRLSVESFLRQLTASSEFGEKCFGLAVRRGSLYLTTPNAQSRAKLHAIGRRRNPQPVYPRSGNADAHHHVREYAMSELVEFVQEAGGAVRALHYSSCWDLPPSDANPGPPTPLRGNLVLVAARR